MYENRVILFLDILGFREIINKTVRTTDGIVEEIAEETEKVKDALDLIYEISTVAGFDLPNSQMKASQFSDSIVISFPVKEKGQILNLIQEIQFLVRRLMFNKVLCRGGVSYGKLYHSERLIFGPGLNLAYETESKAAIYPRIIMDESILKFARKHYGSPFGGEWEQAALEELISQDTDNMFYINYFEKAVNGYSLSLVGKSNIDYYNTLRGVILENLKIEAPDIKIKYLWMKNKFNRMKLQMSNHLAYGDFFKDLEYISA